jgi:hypothetical protein
MGILEAGRYLMELAGLFLMMLACICVASVAVFTIRKAAPMRERLPVTADWIEDLSMEHYRPMLRLLNADDFVLLRSQPGCTPEMIAKLRRQRCQIFRDYLRSLQTDFGQVCMALKLLMVHASHDRPDLASALIRSRIQFGLGMVVVRARLTLYQWGVGSVDVASLLKIFDRMQVELRSLIPSVALGA